MHFNLIGSSKSANKTPVNYRRGGARGQILSTSTTRKNIFQENAFQIKFKK